MTIIHEKGSELHWKDVRELVVGECMTLAEGRARVLEITLFPIWSTGTMEKTVLENTVTLGLKLLLFSQLHC